MNARVIAAAGLAALVLAGCGGTSHPPPAHATHAASAPAAGNMSAADEARLCADLNALEVTGTPKANARATAASADQGWLPGNAVADVAKAIRDHCPTL